MSEVAIGPSKRSGDLFRPATILVLLATGILAFVGMLLLGAYAPEMRSGRDGGTHALSNGATGFAAVIALAEATGRNPEIVRSEFLLDAEELAVLTPGSGFVNLDEALQQRGPRATLIVFPKWRTVRDEAKRGWVRTRGFVPEGDPEQMLAPGRPLDIARRRSGGGFLKTVPAHAPAEMRFAAPAVVQTIRGKDLRPVVTDARGNIVLAQVGDVPLFLLADPDLLANHGLADPRQAAAALAMLDFLNTTDAERVLFDVTLNGLGRSPSPLRLAFDPPFLAATLAIAAALLLAGWQALFRFGPARRPERAIAFGKAALIDNAAALVRKARREARLGARYAMLIAERAAAALGVSERLRDEALDAYLDTIGKGTPFTTLAARAANAASREELRAAAAALHQWQQENIR